jgi:predicted RNA binding protein YcfA (HicA-like mRNA interferase family)
VLKRTSEKGTAGWVVPFHPELAIGTLRGILKQAGVEAEEFVRNL